MLISRVYDRVWNGPETYPIIRCLELHTDEDCDRPESRGEFIFVNRSGAVEYPHFWDTAVTGGDIESLAKAAISGSPRFIVFPIWVTNDHGFDLQTQYVYKNQGTDMSTVDGYWFITMETARELLGHKRYVDDDLRGWAWREWSHEFDVLRAWAQGNCYGVCYLEDGEIKESCWGIVEKSWDSLTRNIPNEVGALHENACYEELIGRLEPDHVEDVPSGKLMANVVEGPWKLLLWKDVGGKFTRTYPDAWGYTLRKNDVIVDFCDGIEEEDLNELVGAIMSYVPVDDDQLLRMVSRLKLGVFEE